MQEPAFVLPPLASRRPHHYVSDLHYHRFLNNARAGSHENDNGNDDRTIPTAMYALPPRLPRTRKEPDVENNNYESLGTNSGTYSMLFQTILIAAGIVVVKLLVTPLNDDNTVDRSGTGEGTSAISSALSWAGEMELKEISLVFTGLFFILGQMFENLNFDLKEALKMPSDVIASIHQIEDFFKVARGKIPNYEEKAPMYEPRKILVKIVRNWHVALVGLEVDEIGEDGGIIEETTRKTVSASASVNSTQPLLQESSSSTNPAETPSHEDGVHTTGKNGQSTSSTTTTESSEAYSNCLNGCTQLAFLASEWEQKRGAKVIVRIPRLIDQARRSISRSTVIKRTDVLPCAAALGKFFILMTSLLLFLAKYKTAVGLTMVMLSVLTVSIFMGRIMAVMDDPFCSFPKNRNALLRWFRGHAPVVELFPLLEYVKRTELLIAEEEAKVAAMRSASLAKEAQDKAV